VPPVSGSSIWTRMLPPSSRGNSTRRFIGILHFVCFFHPVFTGSKRAEELNVASISRRKSESMAMRCTSSYF
jgi:hypothetical protein